MTEFLNKISIYDQLSYIVVGGLFYSFFDYDLSFFGLDLKRITENAFGIAVAVYFLGHVAQAVANQFIRENKDSYTQRECDILNEIKQNFGIKDYSDKEAFGICYMWALANDKTAHVETMNARYGLYRGWFVVLFLQSVFYLCLILKDAIHKQYDVRFLVGLAFTVPIGFLMKKRSKRFYQNIADKTFQTFIVFKKNAT
ncbi:hypothetical protein GCM10028803_15850 [Larkinella knui]|uniref:Uncharacterized protein n=1 Tax=Larkinella knui TaxID=2025310 RepID=A0A3P1CAQ9_9BACT|nr:hypothetical protein [Larkinella knui]RRB09954.1 hypothetical protein EHT87_31030 [Larkinella knui]